MKKDKRIDQYISRFPKNVQTMLKKIRTTIRDAARDAEEGFGYGVPSFSLHGKDLVYFAAFKKHIGFYPTPSGIKKFKKELSDYKTSAGTVQFPFGEKIPFVLIARIVKFRATQI